MTNPLPIEKGSVITIVSDLGVATQYEVIQAELQISERFDMFCLEFVDPKTSKPKKISLYADQIEVFDSRTEEPIDIYA